MANNQTSLAETKSKTLLVIFSEPAKMINYQNSLTIKKAINGFQIRKFIKLNGSDVILPKIVEMIIETGLYFGSETPVSLTVMVANDIIDKYPYETIEDLLQAFKMIRRGELTENYDSRSFSVSKILEFWLPRYFDKKAEVLEREKAKKISNHNYKNEWPDEWIEKLKEATNVDKESKEKLPHKYLTDKDEIEVLRNQVLDMSIRDVEELINHYKNQSIRPLETFKDQLEILEKRLKELTK